MTRKPLKILHVALLNSGFAADFCHMHNESGDYSRLVTFYRNKMGFAEDICMDYRLPEGKLVDLWRKIKQNSIVKRRAANPKSKKYHYFRPKNLAEKEYFKLVDRLREPLVAKVIADNNLDEFDIIHYDFALDFYRNAKQAVKWKEMGKKIVCCYYGSDLRIRGVIKELEQVSDLNITGEYDHLALHPELEFMFFPYDTSELPARKNVGKDIVKIVHSPTNRQFKGTANVIEAIEMLRKERNDFEFILLENRPRSEVLEIKSGCHIGIECISGEMGGYGYGKSGLEMLGMGLPVVTSMPHEYAQWLPENPFIIANSAQELYHKLKELMQQRDLIEKIGIDGKKWVNKYHSFEAVNKKLYELYRKYKLIE